MTQTYQLFNAALLIKCQRHFTESTSRPSSQSQSPPPLPVLNISRVTDDESGKVQKWSDLLSSELMSDFYYAIMNLKVLLLVRDGRYHIRVAFWHLENINVFQFHILQLIWGSMAEKLRRVSLSSISWFTVFDEATISGNSMHLFILTRSRMCGC